MKFKLEEKVEIPEGIACTYSKGIFTCKKDSTELTRPIKIPEVNLDISGNTITFKAEKINKKGRKVVFSYLKHIKNMIAGVQEKYVYKLESANVHFPMTIKVQGDKLVITNFLGEKVPREARIMPNVEVDVKGSNITISSHDKEAAGQTAGNFEKAVKITNRDRRIFQDGIYITHKPGAKE